MPAHETKHMGAEEVIGLVTGLRPFREKRLNRYEFPELAKRGTIPPPNLPPLPELDLSAHKQDHHKLPALDDHHNHAQNGHALWKKSRKLPTGYLDPDKRY